LEDGIEKFHLSSGGNEGKLERKTEDLSEKEIIENNNF
jgi:hypothetical protein